MIFGRLQIYYSEVLHEATHFNFFRSFRLNNIISNVLLYPFLLITVEQNRKSHFIHHSFKEEGEEYFTSNDPETGIYCPNDFSLSNVLKSQRKIIVLSYNFRLLIYDKSCFFNF